MAGHKNQTIRNLLILIVPFLVSRLGMTFQERLPFVCQSVCACLLIKQAVPFLVLLYTVRSLPFP